MPQFDVTTFAPQLFWLAVTFITLYVLMSKVALPRIGEVLDERQRKIDDNLDKAAALKAEAEAAVAAYEKALAESRANAMTVLRETQEKLAAQAAKRQADLNAKLAEQIKAGEKRIAEARDKALESVRDIAAEVAVATVTRLTGAETDRAAVDKAIAAAAKE